MATGVEAAMVAVARTGWVERAVAADWSQDVASLIVGLNVFDMLMTLVFLQTGRCTEANPFMAALYACSPVLFASVKLTMVPVGTLLLLTFREFTIARFGLYLGLLTYTGLAALHCSYLAAALM